MYTPLTPEDEPSEMRLVIDGNTWTCMFKSPGEVTYSYDSSQDGSDWTTLGRGKIMKQH